MFVTSAGAGVTDATIDSGRVTDPSALTGSDYTLQFSVSGGVTTYAVLQGRPADRGDRGALRLRARRSTSTA